MKFSATVLAISVASCGAFSPAAFGVARTTVVLNAEIRKPTEKSKELRFGWDGTTALGGAVVDSTPARMLDEIRAAGETVPDDCEVFNANLEMDASDLKFEEVMEMLDVHYETGLIEFKNGDLLNKQGENEGSAKVLSYAALAEFDKETTLKVRLSRPSVFIAPRYVHRLFCAPVVFSFSLFSYYYTYFSFGVNTTGKSLPTQMATLTRIFATS
jgi:hypothetical protein